MHKHILIFSVFLFLLSCRHSPVEDDFNLAPSLSFVQTGTSICEGSTLMINQAFSVQLKAKGNTKFKKQVSNIKVVSVFNFVKTIVLDTTIIADSCLLDLNLRSQNTKGLEEWQFIVTDEDKRTKELSFVIKTINYPPNISFIEGSNYTYFNKVMNINQDFWIGIDAKSNEQGESNLSNFRISRTINNNREVLVDSTISTTSFMCLKTFTTNSTEATEKWAFVITDSKGESDSIGVNLYTMQITYMDVEKYGVIWNLTGTNANAWDLVQNISVDINNTTNADMINTTGESSVAPYYFSNEWQALNESTFKRNNNYDYNNASIETAIDAYTSATIIKPSPLATGIAKDDIYVVKIRNSQNYAVIEVTNVIYTEDSNLDKIEFRYKKAE